MFPPPGATAPDSNHCLTLLVNAASPSDQNQRISADICISFPLGAPRCCGSRYSRLAHRIAWRRSQSGLECGRYSPVVGKSSIISTVPRFALVIAKTKTKAVAVALNDTSEAPCAANELIALSICETNFDGAEHVVAANS